jgi:glycosyltransferase involved in cell wall biosynthesis
MDFDGQRIDDPMFRYEKPSIANRVIAKLKSIALPSDLEKFNSKLRSIEPVLEFEVISSPFSRLQLETHPLIREADIVHLHWVGNILNFPSFFNALHKPVVWTLHDMNPFSGLFHYEADELQSGSATFLDREAREIKRKAIRQIDNGAVISPSVWLLEKAAKSKVFDSFGIKETIPNSIDTSLFGSIDKEMARKELNLDTSAKVLLFTAAQLDIHRKGFDLLLEALEDVNSEVIVLTMGKGSLQVANKNVKIIPLGYMTDETEIAKCYAAADAFLLPSREDNLPNTMLEAFAAGTAVVAFENGGMKEHIKTGINGVLMQQTNPSSLANAINDILNGVYTFDPNVIRTYARDHFSAARQASAYLKIYRDLLT